MTRDGSHGALGLGLALFSAATFGTAGTFADSLMAIGWTPGAVVTFRIVIAALLLTVPALRALRGRWDEVRAAARVDPRVRIRRRRRLPVVLLQRGAAPRRRRGTAARVLGHPVGRRVPVGAPRPAPARPDRHRGSGRPRRARARAEPDHGRDGSRRGPVGSARGHRPRHVLRDLVTCRGRVAADRAGVGGDGGRRRDVDRPRCRAGAAVPHEHRRRGVARTIT